MASPARHGRLACLVGWVVVAITGIPPMDAARGAEPATIILPEATTLQAFTGDVTGDGRREVLRLVRTEEHATVVEVWWPDGGSWARLPSTARVLPPARRGVRAERIFADVPLRFLAWHDGMRERVMVASQPSYHLLDAGPPCCLLLSEVIVVGDSVRLVDLADPTPFADALLVLDLDGDGIDELLVTRSLHPGGDVSFPLEARVHRYVDGAFGPPEVTILPFGARDAPFLLGETDGRPGREAGILATAGPAPLLRIRLDEDGGLVMDRAGMPNLWAASALPTRSGSVLLTSRREGLTTWDWPAGGDPVRLDRLPGDALLLGVVGTPERPRAVAVRRANGTLELYDGALRWHSVSRSRAAVELAAAGARLYAGPLPGGGPEGQALVIHGGHMVGFVGDESPLAPQGVRPMAAMADAVPVGLAGNGEWLVIEHTGLRLHQLEREGGWFMSPVAVPGAWYSIAPLAAVLEPESPDAVQAEVIEAGDVFVDGPPASGPPGDRRVVVGSGGFVVELTAAPGSRVRAIGSDPSERGRTGAVVGDSGRLRVPMEPPTTSTPNPRYRAALVVTTPTGHGHVIGWQVDLLNAPPGLTVRAETPFLSSEVIVSGSVPSRTAVTVAGRTVEIGDDGTFVTGVTLPPWPTEIEVVATDPVGNVARQAVVGIGVVDYRALPWVPILGILVVVVGVVLYRRTPTVALARPADDDDGHLEELDPD